MPLAPPYDFDDDYGDDAEEEPAWWGTIRPPAPGWDVAPKPEPPVGDTEAASPRRARARTASEEVCATAHVLRVRARLTLDEQRAFDALVCSDAAADIITMLVNRSELDAVECLRRRMEASAPPAPLAHRIAALGALLSASEQATALARLASLWPEEQFALDERLGALPSPEAAALIRTYLAGW